jgi:hypothetical protein
MRTAFQGFRIRFTGRPLSGASLRRGLALALLGLVASAPVLANGLSSSGSQLIFETGADPFHPPVVGDELGSSVATGDFDCDGVEDLAIGLRSDDGLAGTGFDIFDAGAVQIRFGIRDGALEMPNIPKYIWQGGASSVDEAEDGDFFGQALVAGNFDGDGCDDLAIGIPGEDVGGFTRAGAIEVRYGSANRSNCLEVARQFFTQNTPGVPDTAAASDQFGFALAAGDFNGDGRDDLAIGVPLELVGDQNDAGRVIVLNGSPTGITVAGALAIDMNTPGLGFHSPFLNARFGWAVAAGNFDNDPFDDLAIGEPMVATAWGLAFVVYGTASGLNGSRAFEIYQGAGGLDDASEAGDGLGFSLATGQFDSDPYADLVVGVPGEGVSTGGPEILRAGAVHLLFGTPTGLSHDGSRRWTALTAGIPGDPEENDYFGLTVAAGDFDHDHYDELVIGVPYEQNFLGPEEGDVVVLPGSETGPQAAGSRTWNLQAPGILGDMNAGDRLGWSLAIGDFDDDLHADLAVGTPGDGFIGGVLVLYGSLFADNFESGDSSLWDWAVP